MTLSELKKHNIPKEAGVYFFKDSQGEILYIGKATSLKDRLRSYFASDLIETRGPHIVDMVFKAKQISWQVCANALEALILEASEIKKYKPYYNTREKDDKSFNCLVITKEDFPRVLLVRQKDISYKTHTARVKKEIVEIDKVFGPFPSGTAIKEALRLVRRIFPFRDNYSVQKDREVFYRQIGLSPNLTSEHAKQKYKETIKEIKLFFSGKFADLRKEIKQKMNQSAEILDFESANDFKKKLFALDHVEDISLLKRENLAQYDSGGFRIEAYDVAHLSGKNMVGVMVVCSGGVLVKSEYKKFNIKTQTGANDPGALREILERRFSHDEWTMPDLIVVDGNDVQKKVAEDVIRNFCKTELSKNQKEKKKKDEKINKLKNSPEIKKKIAVVAVVKDDKHRVRAILGEKGIVEKYKLDILLANNDAHRFALGFYKKTASRNFIKVK